MTTHALSATSQYNNEEATYGWAGSTEDGKCTLQSFLNPDSASASPFPDSLASVVKPAAKGYQYSSNEGVPLGSSTALDKFWAPSMFEMYGQSGGSYDGWWSNENEGKQYKIFEDMGIKHSSYAPFSNLDIPQNGVTLDRTSFVWSRSLCGGGADRACVVFGDPGGIPSSGSVLYGRGVVSCFCI